MAPIDRPTLHGVSKKIIVLGNGEGGGEVASQQMLRMCSISNAQFVAYLAQGANLHLARGEAGTDNVLR